MEVGLSGPLTLVKSVKGGGVSTGGVEMGGDCSHSAHGLRPWESGEPTSLSWGLCSWLPL